MRNIPPLVFIYTTLLLVFNLVPPTTSYAVERKVPEDYASIQAAIDAANNDDLITVGSGHFEEKLVIRYKLGLVIRGAGREHTIIDGGVTEDENDRDGAVISIYADSTATISDVAIVGQQYHGIKSGIYISDAIRLTNVTVKNSLIGTRQESGDDVTFNIRQGFTGGNYCTSILVQNEINGRDRAIEIGPYSTVSIRENEIFSSRTGILFRGLIEGPILNNILTGTPSTFSTGIDIVSSSPLVQNNIIRDFATSGIDSNGSSSKPKVLNNTIINNGYNGIIIKDRSRPVIMNNIIGESRYGIWIAYDLLNSDTFSYSYNNLYNNQTNYKDCLEGEGAISVNPMFEDAASGNFGLQTGSTCIDAGNPDTQFNDTDSTRNDLGAFGGCNLQPTPASDIASPTIPVSLQLDSNGFFDSVISWSPSSDNIGILGYKIYLNGVESYHSSTTHATLSGLFPETDYEVLLLQ